MTIRTDIVPSRQERAGPRDELDLQAVCAFVSIGYFLSDSTYYKGCKTLEPASIHTLDENGSVAESRRYFNWHHSPRDLTLRQAVEEFAELFEGMLAENTDPLWTIAISGGLDSRTLVAAARHLKREFTGYSYAFRGGHDETMYGRRMADMCGFEFHRYEIVPGTLWEGLERLARINQCYSEFTHPRQFSVFERLKSMGGTFLLGHLGDLLFDDMHVDDDMPHDMLFELHLRRVVKPRGLELGRRLWQAWGLEGSLEEYIRDSLRVTFDRIDIPKANPKLRAFKTWTHVTRWTNSNLSIFHELGPNLYPYMDNRMVEFVCSLPEKWLAGRRIQIEYLKMRSPSLSRIPWQSHHPFNLYSYRLDRSPFNLPLRAIGKVQRTLKRGLTVTRNWEIQFLGAENERRLGEMLVGDKRPMEWIPVGISRNFLEDFLKEKTVDTYHPVSMLLTLSAFHRYIHKRD